MAWHGVTRGIGRRWQTVRGAQTMATAWRIWRKAKRHNHLAAEDDGRGEVIEEMAYEDGGKYVFFFFFFFWSSSFFIWWRGWRCAGIAGGAKLNIFSCIMRKTTPRGTRPLREEEENQCAAAST
jgi:hypothetical protein